MVERDVGGERVNELVLSHERIVRGFRVSIRHLFFGSEGDENGERNWEGISGCEMRVSGSETNLSSQVDRW